MDKGIGWKRKLLKYGRMAVKIGSEVSDVVVHLKERPGTLGVVAVGSRTLNSIIETLDDEDPSKVFDGWETFSLKPIEDFVLKTSVDHRLAHVASKSGHSSEGSAIVVRLGDAVFGWVVYSNWKNGPFKPPGQSMGKTREAIAELLWAAVGKNLVTESVLGGTNLVDDMLTESLPSETANMLWDRQKAFIDRGYSRAVLLYGDPGTGKSHIIRQVAKMAGGRSLRVKARKLKDSSHVAKLIRILRPDAVLIDDFDRISDPSGVIDDLEELRASAKQARSRVPASREIRRHHPRSRSRRGSQEPRVPRDTGRRSRHATRNADRIC